MTTLAVQKYGNPNDPAVVFLHGAGVSSWMWTAQIDDLKSSFFCLTIDLPGSGDSYQTEWRSFENTANQIAAIILDEVPEKKAHIVGLSLGGYAALYLLAQHPEVVDSMIVSGVTTRPFRRQWLYRPLMNVMGLVSKWDVMINLNIRMMNLPEEVMPLYKRDSKRASRSMFQSIYTTLFDFTLPEKLYQCVHRVLAVAGDKEVDMITQGLDDFHDLPNGTSRLIPDAHHAWNAEYPTLFSSVVRAWITNQPLPEVLLFTKQTADRLGLDYVAPHP